MARSGQYLTKASSLSSDFSNDVHRCSVGTAFQEGANPAFFEVPLVIEWALWLCVAAAYVLLTIVTVCV